MIPAADTMDLRVPDGFVDLPHLDDPSVLDAKLREIVALIAADAPPSDRDALLALYRAGYGQVLREGAIYIGYGYFRTDADDLSICTLNVFVKDHPEANPYLIVSQTAAQHAEGGPAHTPGMVATPVELPCGPAVFIMRMTLAPDDVPAAAPVAWQAQAVIPFPQGKKVIVIDLSTPCPTEASYYAGILDGIAHTVTFTTTPEPATSASTSRIADALG